MEGDLGARLGPSARCFCYHHFLSHLEESRNHERMVQICANPNHVAKVEHILFDTMLDRGIAQGMRRSIHITEDTAQASLVELRQLFAELSQRLTQSGGEYLMDTKTKSYGLTAADVTLAALASPVLRPRELQDWLLPFDQFPNEINDLTKELVATKAGQHVLKIYRKHRLQQQQKGDRPARVVMKTQNRDRFPSEWFVGIILVPVGIIGAFFSAPANTSNWRARKPH